MMNYQIKSTGAYLPDSGHPKFNTSEVMQSVKSTSECSLKIWYVIQHAAATVYYGLVHNSIPPNFPSGHSSPDVQETENQSN